VNRLQSIFTLALAAVCAACTCAASAQQSFYERTSGHNASMAVVQPTRMGPLIQSDGRLVQALRFSVSNSTLGDTHPLSYGDGHSISMIVNRRFQLDLDPPSFFRNHSSTMKDGFGNAGTQVKYCIASGNAQHGNFAVSAILFHGFAPRAYQSHVLSSYYKPSIAAGRGFGRFAALTTVGGFLPTGKIAEQGRTVEWNFTGQAHASAHLWFDVENNATLFHAGPLDGKMQNFITPAAFYMIRRKEWKPEHAAVVFACGMQTATSGYHFYNHNLVTEMRVMF
jgi:hypothetical protein